MSDEIVWQIINQQFCSFKLSTREKTFCRFASLEAPSQIGPITFEETPDWLRCKQSSGLPLPNGSPGMLGEENADPKLDMLIRLSAWPTRENHVGGHSQYRPKPSNECDRSERAHQPSKLWEKRRLSPNYQTALKQIDDMLQYWPGFLVHKAKSAHLPELPHALEEGVANPVAVVRLTRLTQVAIRMRRIAKEEARLGEKTVPKLAPKIRKREATRERKAEAAAKLERTIERELLQRLREGAYGDQPLNVSESIWKKVLNEMEREGDATRDKDLDKGIEDEEEEENENEYELEEDEEDGAVEYVSDLEESDDDLDDIEDWLGSDQESDEEDSASEASDDAEQDAKKKPAAGGKRKEAPVRKPKKGIKRRKEIEHEVEYEPRAQELAF
ncbi:putative Protein MAK16 [Seiridium cardinale]|uniref:Protein MAK16 homolog n=1 Tax=Seiridium cardinale TaxID=138064 RepID=A0ABR2X667_9PEZI